MLATIDDIKDRLGVDDADTTQDDDLNAVLGGASERILDATAYLEADTTAFSEIIRNVQQGREYTVSRRPIANLVVKGRGHGTTFQNLSVDLLDPSEGVFMVMGSAEWWPPNYVEERRPRFRRWREPIWPVLQATYDVTGIVVGGNTPPALREATIALAKYWLDLSRSGAVEDVRIGQLAQTMSKEKGLPSHVKSMLGRHYRGVGATWVR